MGFLSFLKEKISNKKNEKLNKSLEKTRNVFSSRLLKLNEKYSKVNQEYFDELEEILFESDCGVSFSLGVIEDLLKIVKKDNISDVNLANECLIKLMLESYGNIDKEDLEISFKNKPEILLVVGVNGVGKTTTIAKLANYYKLKNKNILLISGDTFRAGAVEQLNLWATKIGCDIYSGNDCEDPSSVIYQGVSNGIKGNYDLIIIDTAGRLQNKQNLMDEMSKINKTIHKLINYDFETFLVLDSTTGQNGIIQAKSFKELIGLTGIVLTKIDGTSKGGSILSIKKELGVPVRFIGYGESINDIDVFDIEKFIYSICSGIFKDE